MWAWYKEKQMPPLQWHRRGIRVLLDDDSLTWSSSIMIYVQETVGMGPFVIRTTCRACKGSKFVINSPCTECGGKGKTIQRKNVNIVVPAGMLSLLNDKNLENWKYFLFLGVEDGQTVRIRTGTQEVFVTFRVGPSLISSPNSIMVMLGKCFISLFYLFGDATLIPGREEQDISTGRSWYSFWYQYQSLASSTWRYHQHKRNSWRLETEGWFIVYSSLHNFLIIERLLKLICH